MKKETVLVIGASGTVGSEVGSSLKAQGYTVKSATSKKASGENSVYLNLATGEGINSAFEGVDRAFLLSPPGYADQYRMLSPLIQEAKRRGLRKVVLMTAMGANAVETAPFRKAEIELEKSGLAYNIVRPNWFMQNFNTFWVEGIKQHGKILLPVGTAKTSFIDAKDISDVVTKLLISDEFNNQAFDITGPEALNHDEVAALISEATGKKIVYSEIQPAELKKAFFVAGMPEDYSDFLLMILGFLKEGYNAGITDGVKRILGREPRTMKNYAKEYRSSWV
ncbi:SDR family oxidoreductase [Bdellovibrio reynosensis]|uniref:SDR family oxidoreductase n=1 Tax=Bdellovibrio reynosensis TaxID=2835041 RepID=A0ABY4CCF7_9BACT|nr:SDR family oxidoreductase [Bdellovibrio reynosensis]UOF02464.1 SDR family oxidoreductase [Bdellovibrio reynosensis]